MSSGDEKIITGGVVSADGYDPIIITKTEENSSDDENSSNEDEEKI